MVALSDKIQKFANWSGAKIKPQEKQPLEVDVPNFVADSEQPHEEAPTDTLVESKFERNTAPWKNPNITLGTAIGVAGVISAVGFFAVNSNVQWPTMGGPTLSKAANNDDLEPVNHPDGKVETAALTSHLGEGLDRDANNKNPFVTSVKPTNASPTNNVKGATTTQGKLSSTKPIYPTTMASTMPTIAMAGRTVSRPAYTDYGYGGATTPSRTVAPSYAPTNFYRSPYSTRSAASASSSPSVVSAPEKTADERRLAVLAMTSSGTDTTQQNGATATAQSTAAAPGQSQTAAGKPYQDASYLTSEESVLDGIPQQVINRSKKAQGRLMVGVAFTSGAAQFMQGQPVEIAIENPMDTGLPKGAHLIATVDLQSQGNSQTTSAPVRLVATAIAIGDAEYPLPQGTILLTGENGKPLVAKRQGSDFMRFMGSMAKSAVGGIGGIATTLLGASPIMTALSPQLQPGAFGTQSAQQTGNEVLALRENTPIQINIIRPLSLPVSQGESTSGDQALVPTEQKPLFPVPAPPETTAYREPTDAELTGLVQQQQQEQWQQSEQQPVQPQDQQQQPMEDSQQNVQ